MAKKKQDLSKERQKELLKIIDENKSIYNINKKRRELLSRRMNYEIMKLNNEFFVKVYMNIPIYYNKTPDFTDLSFDNQNWLYGQLESSKLKIVDEIDLCEIKIKDNYYEDMKIEINYSNIYSWKNNDLKTQSIKVKYLSTIYDRVLILEDEHINKIKQIKSKYKKLIDVIDKNTSFYIWKKSEKEYEHIQNQLKFEPGLKYIFDHTATLYKSSGVKYYMKWLKMIKTTPQYVFIEFENSLYNAEIKTIRIKKHKVLSVLKNNKYHFEKNVVRSKKLDRILSNLE